MGKKKNATSEMNVAEKQSTNLASRLNDLITDGEALKKYLNVSSQAINQYKLGISRPSLDNLCKIADYYKVSVDYLLGRTNTQTVEEDIQIACETTGLSENAVKILSDLNRASWHGVSVTGQDGLQYEIYYISLISDLIESTNDFYSLLAEISHFLIYGGALPAQFYTPKGINTSVDSWEQLHRLAASFGLDAVPRKELRELHLQRAAEQLKDICRKILQKELESKSGQGGSDNAIN